MKAQEEHEGLIAVRDRLESGRVFVEEQLAKTKVHCSNVHIKAYRSHRWGNRSPSPRLLNYALWHKK